MWVPTADCTSCPQANRFDDKSSTSFNKLSDSPTKLVYGKGTATGYLAEDQVCLSSGTEACLPKYKFLTVTQTEDFNQMAFDAMLGQSYGTLGYNTGIFIDELFNAGLVKEKVFSFYLTRTPSDSRCIFGGYDSKYIKSGDNSSITWNALTDDAQYWATPLTGASIGDQTI